ncbi:MULTISPECIES: hypothetical protein [unclassified Prochlorococcus]|uniref:hypothetical protein n=1 Tax=unclassified Prochlorococcus TaxID=2627481 RepID=UPI000533BB2D|nr:MULTISPECIES: hypothetical protein [unclassified Prochlorococcus]KGG16126.1 putative protein family PM-7 [Prochlorococcus sp. MIT 0602]KGG17244.1 putative protein family PM-7 [Prochlorococcus sp. MIT 0603]
MNDENWKEEFKKWKPTLKPFQVKLLEDGPCSQSQTLMLCDMWCEWKTLALKRDLNEIPDHLDIADPWDETDAEMSAPYR